MPLYVTLNAALQEYENKLDLLQYNTRKKLLIRVYSYLKVTYHREIKLVNTAEYKAFKMICDRIEYNHHATYGF